MEVLLVIGIPYLILLVVGGIVWESKTPEEKKEMEERWERERIQRQSNRKENWREFWFGERDSYRFGQRHLMKKE